MEIELNKEDRALAIASLERYFNEHFAEALDGQRLGNIQAGALLNFFIEEVGPCVYNQAIADAQERLSMRVTELDIECHADAFGYWQKRAPKPAGKR